MAPWPEQGNELKSIDKVNEIRSSSFDETQHHSKTDHLDDKGKPAKADDSQDPQVLGLDEGQLKALLDEAITYKNPKDREGKSELFKELLQEVEADDKSGSAATPAGTGGVNAKNPIHSATSSARFNRNHRRSNQYNSSGRHISERNRSGGSLQNLVQAYASELEGAGGYSRRRGGSGAGAGGRGTNLRGSSINVSARQREGGSLPSNVNHVQGVSGASTNLFDDYKRSRDIMPPTEDKLSSESGLCTDYSSSTNTHSRKTSSTWGDEEGIELEDMRAGARVYTSRATLEVYTDPSGDDVNNTVDVDSSVLFPLKSKCSPTPFTSSLSSSGDTDSHTASSNSTSSASTYNYVRLSDLEYCTSSLLGSGSHATSSSTTKNESSGNIISTLSIPPQPISLGASVGSQSEDRNPSQQTAAVNTPQVSMLLTARDYHTLTPFPHAFHLSDLFSEPLQAYSGGGYISSVDKCKSGYDENGNTLTQTDRKKARRHKAKNEKNTYLAETVDGFRGTLDLDELLLFIENEPGPGGKKKSKMSAAQQHHKKKTKDDSEQPKKRKGKDKLTKCNSLEEISKTKLEDLTSTPCQSHRLRPKKQVTLDDEELGWHHREDDANSVSADEALVGRKRMKDTAARDKDRDDEESEFRLVQTKKHRRRKRRSSHNEQNQADVFRTARSSPDHHRTSSMPPSDRSDCSDLDSVHSLPVTSQHGRRGGTVTPSSQEYTSASTSPSGAELNHSVAGMASKGASPTSVASGGEVNLSGAGTGKASRQRVTSSPGKGSGNTKTTHARSNSCTFGSSGVSGAAGTNGEVMLTKAVSCHSSSMCVNDVAGLVETTGSGLDGPAAGRSLTKSTPNSTVNLASHASTTGGGNAEKSVLAQSSSNHAVSTRARSSGEENATSSNPSNVGRSSKSVSPERRNKSDVPCGSPTSHTSNVPVNHRVHGVDNQPTSQDCCPNQPGPTTIGWTDGDYPPLPANVTHPPTTCNHSQRSDRVLNGLPRGECVRNVSTDRRNGSVNRRTGTTVSEGGRNGPESIVCNGDSIGPGSATDEIETVTLRLKKNNNKHRAPSPSSGPGRGTSCNSNTNNNNCCDVFVEFSLPPPPPPSSTVPVDVTVEKTVIIRSQSCTGVSESVSLIIPPPPSTVRRSSSRNHPQSGTVHSVSGTVSTASPLPAVILLDSRTSRKKRVDDVAVSVPGGPTDLTFGFEINRTLLSRQDGHGSAPAREAMSPARVLVSKAQDDQRLLSECFNYTDIVNFIGNAWKDVLKDLTSQKSSGSHRVDYYTAPSSPLS